MTLLRLSLPIVLMQVGFQLMHFVDTSMVGHLSKVALTARLSSRWCRPAKSALTTRLGPLG